MVIGTMLEMILLQRRKWHHSWNLDNATNHSLEIQEYCKGYNNVYITKQGQKSAGEINNCDGTMTDKSTRQDHGDHTEDTSYFGTVNNVDTKERRSECCQKENTGLEKSSNKNKSNIMIINKLSIQMFKIIIMTENSLHT